MASTQGAVIYTRVSGGEQDKHGTSPETQRDACRAKALALGLPIIAEYYDPAISGGFLLARKGMQAALGDIQTERANTLICANLSRYSRDVEHQQAIKKAVQSAGGRLVFCDMDFDDTPEGDLNFAIQGGFAEYERKVIKKRTMGGRTRRAEEGLQPARTHSPFGYKVVSKTDVLRGEQPAHLLGKYLVLEAEAAAARFLFDGYAAGTHSLTDLTRWLNATGVPCRQKASFWSVSSVSYILANPVYKGLGTYGRRDHAQDEGRLTEKNKHTGLPLKTLAFTRPADPSTWITWEVPALVSVGVWEAVQARFAENKRLKGGNPRTVRMLAGRIFCPACGAGLVCKRSDSRRAKKHPEENPIREYACGKYLRKLISTGERGCIPTHYRIAAVEADVLTILEDGSRNPLGVSEALAAYSEPLAEEDADTQAQDLARIEAALKELEAKQAAAVRGQITGIMAGADPAAYSAVFAEIAEQRAALQEHRAALAVVQSRQARRQPQAWQASKETDFAHILADVRRVLTSPQITGEEKRDTLGTLIERVSPSKEGTEVVFLPGAFSSTTLQPYLFSKIRSSALNSRRPMPIGEAPAQGAQPPYVGQSQSGYQPYQ